jgi:hypothetical protein
MSEETLNGIIPSEVFVRVYFETNAGQIMKERNDVEEGATGSFSTPRKSWPRRENIVASVGGLDEDIR